jgi:hypothetical protein
VNKTVRAMTTTQSETTASTSGPWLSVARKWWGHAGSILFILGLANLFDNVLNWARNVNWIVSKYAGVREWFFAWLPFSVHPIWQDIIVIVLVVFTVTNIGFYQRTGRTYVGYVAQYVPFMLASMLLPFALSFGSLYLLSVLSNYVASGPDVPTWFLVVSLIVIAFSIPVGLDLRERLPWPKPVRRWYAILEGRSNASSRLLERDRIAWRMTAIVAGIAAVVYFTSGFYAHRFGIHPTLLSMIGIALFYFALSGAFLAWRWVLGTVAVFGLLVVVNFVYVRWLA